MNEMIGLIGGSGLGDVFARELTNVRKVNVKTPFGTTSDKIITGHFAGRQIAFLNRHGFGHTLNPSIVPFAANIYALKKIGVTSLIGTTAVGSLTKKIKPTDLVIVDQVIDKTFKRQNTFFDGIAAVHCEMSKPYCERLRKVVADVSKKAKAKVHNKGTYVCMEGPQFSTRAESLMHQKWGGQLIGMTAMPEAKLAREAQMCYVLISMVSDYDCWQEHKKNADSQALIKEIIGNLNDATANTIKLIDAVLRSEKIFCDDKCACRKSLELAVWTGKEHINKKYAEIFKILRS
ncbi:MAG: methylthioadenosine phosphorylase [Planctomycetes bacterium GWF2_42_9]|nr:MAG: methylthioadenosine phosphorylase [Planctomycetes bacterium GWF2_42_9]HAL45958.1 S-methyl-5'-thioadenosine phosphorylase [Phycisphaerales bacterium]